MPHSGGGGSSSSGSHHSSVPVPITAEEVEVPLLEQDTAKSRGRITQRIVPMTMMSMYVTEMGLRSSVMWGKKNIANARRNLSSSQVFFRRFCSRYCWVS